VPLPASGIILVPAEGGETRSADGKLSVGLPSHRSLWHVADSVSLSGRGDVYDDFIFSVNRLTTEPVEGVQECNNLGNTRDPFSADPLYSGGLA